MTEPLPTILVINPGSTSTKVAIFEGATASLQQSLEHGVESQSGTSVWDQFETRRESIAAFLKSHRLERDSFSAVVGRGGLLRSVKGGVYRVNEKMIADARANLQGEHVSNLGCALAKEFARAGGAEAFIVDPVSVDEFEPLARYSGHPLFERRALAHSLNIHEAARRAADYIKKPYQEAHFVVAHLGGGISIAPVKKGKIIDVNDASSGGPFSPERSGALPLQRFITLCYSGDYSEAEMRKLVMGKGGLLAYLGTNSAEEIEARIERDERKAREVYQAMAYQIAKEIGAMATVLEGFVDAIVLTGGLAKSALLCDWIEKRVFYIAQVILYPGEFEMEAMAHSALRVLEGRERAQDY